MGVMSCGRRDCQNILCEHLLFDGSEYICNACLQELKEQQKTWPKAGQTAADVRTRVEQFMDSPKGSMTPVDADQEFARLIGEPQ